MNKLLLYATLLYLLQVITIINAQLNPNVRTLQNAALAGKRLYIFGGFHDGNFNATIEAQYNLNPDDRFFYLDLSTRFDTSNVPWTQIPGNAKNLPLNFLSKVSEGGLTASPGGINSDTIFFINNGNTKPPVLSYNTRSNSWTTQSITGARPIGGNQLKPILDNRGKIYLLTGNRFTTDQGASFSSGLFVIDTIKLNCSLLHPDSAPISRVEYAATLLPNGIIVYMGGKLSDGTLPTNNLQTLFLYDTINDSWTAQVANGTIPASDNGMSSVLGLDGETIIVFGGNNNANNFVLVLDTTRWEWKVPNITGKGPTDLRNDHSAVVVGIYMVIAFGSGASLNFDYRTHGINDVLLLDISDNSQYKWTTAFDPNAVANINSSSSTPSSTSSASSTTPSTSGNNNQYKNETGIIIGAVIGSLAVILIVIAFLFVRRKRKNMKFIPTPGNREIY